MRIFTDVSFDASLFLLVTGGILAYLRPEWRETIGKGLAGLLPLLLSHLGHNWPGGIPTHDDKPKAA